ncbi:uncharacterized protein RAG0_04746 [Rhynchosporium agropyri]|uniref:Cip1-like core domain-containing protein n=1 Tax=Rhynchosporium agropyri TaxID=914238 RepID=A0A1E1KA77_9HELO|nr:uncharacterized protein RAG0_04746 [Rhynchosporium agropyri]
MLHQLAVLTLALLPTTFAQVSEGFESGWDQTAWPIFANDCMTGGNVSLDATVAHTGTNSMRVDGAGGYCGHVFFGTSKVPVGDVYVRTWLKAAKELTDSHITFIAMPDPAEGVKKNLRVGAMSKILLFNRESDDVTLPNLSPQGVASSVGLPVDKWQCLEYHLGADGSVETWLNDKAIDGLTVKPGVANTNTDQWQRSTVKPAVTAVNFGWESYGNDANTFWYDDIVINSTRIGCT